MIDKTIKYESSFHSLNKAISLCKSLQEDRALERIQVYRTYRGRNRCHHGAEICTRYSSALRPPGPTCQEHTYAWHLREGWTEGNKMKLCTRSWDSVWLNHGVFYFLSSETLR